MANITSVKIGQLGRNDTVVSSISLNGLAEESELLNYLDKRISGEISGEVSIFKDNLKILSGNYIQTNDNSLSVQNFSYKNAFLQAECPDSRWGIACTGSKGYCILSAYPALSAVKLSGDISMLASNTGKKYSWAFASGCDSESLEIKSVDTTTNIVTFKSALPADIANSKVSSETQMIEAFNKDDNALYCPSDPTIGNSIIHNFYANHAEGGSVKAIGKYTHAEGRRTIADNRYSHAEGDGSFAGRMAAHAEGQTTRAYGYYSHAEGRDTVVTNQATAAHAEGYNSKASESGAHAEGGYWLSSKYSENFFGGLASGKGSHAEGNSTSAFGDASHAEGEKTTALCAASHAEGYSTYASSKYAHAEGVETIAQGGEGAHAEGNLTKATGTTSHAEGIKTVASGFASHTEGYQTSATISAAHAEGYLTYAKGAYSHAEGNRTSAIGMYSHAQGEKTKAQRDNAHAAGYMCEANAWNSTAIGRYSRVLSTDTNAFVWQGLYETTNPSFYESKGVGTFCINPKDSALSNVWIGSRNLSDIISTEITSLNKTLQGEIDTKSNVWLSSAAAGQPLEGGKLDRLNIVKFDSLETYNLCSNVLTLSDLALIDEANLNAENERILSVADPEEETDAANKRYVDGKLSGIQQNTVIQDFYDAVSANGIAGIDQDLAISAMYQLISILKNN